MNTLVVGGGPAGSTAALLLARAGRPVTLLERDHGPRDEVCGEFISAEGCDTLRRLGLDPLALGGHPIEKLVLSRRKRSVETRLPFRAVGLSRAVLDTALLGLAGGAGVEVRPGTRVTRLSPLDGRWVAETAQGPVEAERVLLATGKSDLRGVERVTRPPERLIGLKVHLRLGSAQAAALRGAVEIAVLRHGYAGLQLVDGGLANLCLLIERDHFAQLGQDWATLLDDVGRDCTALGQRLAGCETMGGKPLAIYQVPYGYVHRADAVDPAGLYRLGDQAAVIPSFCGDGISIALHTGEAAAHAVLADHTAFEYHAAVRRDVRRGVNLAFRLYRAAKTPIGSTALMAVCDLWPGLIRAGARATRVRGRALDWSSA